MAENSADNWEKRFAIWSQGPSKTEEEKCDNAERMIRDAISAHANLKNRNIKVFLQGSYRNRTNVRADSDVDVCVLCMDSFFPDFSHVPGVSSDSLGFSDSSYGFDDLKKDVYEALVAKFGSKSITKGDKAFDVKENTYRVSADVVPTFEGRLYHRDFYGNLKYHSGTVLECSSDRRRINNWPEQHSSNGVAKHTRTARQFKKKVRCLKNLSNEMALMGKKNAQKMASFLLESMVYNCPDSTFSHITHYEDMKEVVRYLWHATKDVTSAKEMVEVNNIKYLFHSSQGWSREDANGFLTEVWNYVGFTD